ncbi:hypothetical protein WJX73_008443 [Symbiochloris irregularis]|uniref:Uncharacterized protein n=1 Tax=Symbiochloris irregularis TaxID=706552 RepID=A0AAW1NYD3_9CHLO
MQQHRAKRDIGEGPIDGASHKRKVAFAAGGRAALGPCLGTPSEALVSKSGAQNGEAETQEGHHGRQSPAALAWKPSSCKGPTAGCDEGNSLSEPPPILAQDGSNSRMSSEDQYADWPADLRDTQAHYEHNHLQYMQDLAADERKATDKRDAAHQHCRRLQTKLLSAQEAVLILKQQHDEAHEEALMADSIFLRNQELIKQKRILAKEVHEKSLADLQRRKEQSASAGVGLQQHTGNVGSPNSTQLPSSMEADTDKEAADDRGGSDNGIEADFRSNVPSGSTATNGASDVDPDDAMWRDFEPVGDAKGR